MIVQILACFGLSGLILGIYRLYRWHRASRRDNPAEADDDLNTW